MRGKEAGKWTGERDSCPPPSCSTQSRLCRARKSIAAGAHMFTLIIYVIYINDERASHSTSPHCPALRPITGNSVIWCTAGDVVLLQALRQGQCRTDNTLVAQNRCTDENQPVGDARLDSWSAEYAVICPTTTGSSVGTNRLGARYVKPALWRPKGSGDAHSS